MANDTNDKEMQELVRVASLTKNIILYGPPGTGKTRLAELFAAQVRVNNSSSVQTNQSPAPYTNVSYSNITPSPNATSSGASDATKQESGFHYWWVNANPNIWRWSNINESHPEQPFYGQPEGEIKAASRNDLIIGYASGNESVIKKLAIIGDYLGSRMGSGGKTEHGFIVRHLLDLNNTISKGQAKESASQLAESDAIKGAGKGQKTLVSLTTTNAAMLLRVILKYNPEQAEQIRAVVASTNGGSELLQALDSFENPAESLQTDSSSAPDSESLKTQADSPSPDASDTSEENPYSMFITFHPSYAYEDFVEGLRPLTDGIGQVFYKVVDGHFKEICKRVSKATKHQYIIVIDEINRANISKVFGELITLIEDDKRGKEVTLPYSGEHFSVPPNLYIIGTMNSTDRSIALIDIALRRRFAFIELEPDTKAIEKVLTKRDIDTNHTELVTKLLEKLNERIVALLDRDHRIGHSYFMPPDPEKNGGKQLDYADYLHFVWYYRIIPLLQEYFYANGNDLHGILGDDFIEVDNGGRSYKLKEQSDNEELLKNLKKLAGIPAS